MVYHKEASCLCGKCADFIHPYILYIQTGTGRPACLLLWRAGREDELPEEREWAEDKLGLNDPISTQYVRWLQEALHGDFGISYKYKMDVLEVIRGRIGNTLILGGIGFILIFTLALLLGVLCAWFEDRLPDQILCKVGTVTSCIPEFWLSPSR